MITKEEMDNWGDTTKSQRGFDEGGEYGENNAPLPTSITTTEVKRREREHIAQVDYNKRTNKLETVAWLEEFDRLCDWYTKHFKEKNK